MFFGIISYSYFNYVKDKELKTSELFYDTRKKVMKMTQEVFADLVGVNSRTIQNYEAGDYDKADNDVQVQKTIDLVKRIREDALRNPTDKGEEPTIASELRKVNSELQDIKDTLKLYAKIIDKLTSPNPPPIAQQPMEDNPV